MFCVIRWHAHNSDEGQKFFIEEVRLQFALEVCKEELSEVIDLDQTLLVFDHLVELLLQVVKDAVVN